MTVAELAQLLKDAKDAHVEHERLNGPDPDWPLWYARYIVTALRLEKAAAKEWGGTSQFAVGIVFRPGSLWVGAHWSKYNRRLCLNLLPMVTIWFTLPGGKPGTGWRFL